MPSQFTTTKIGVPDLEAAAAFYGSVLGMEVGGKFESYCEWVLRFPGGEPIDFILYDTVHGTLAHRPVGSSWLVFMVDDLAATAERFRAAGIEHVGDPVTAVEFGVNYVITEDPFGNVIELTEPIG